MNTTKKKLSLILVAVLCVVLSVGVLTACNDNTGDGGTAYSVTVLLPDETPAGGVEVTVEKDGASFTANTGADGKAAFSLAEGEYTVTFDKLPAHFKTNGEQVKLTATDRDVTVTLEEEFFIKVSLLNIAGGTPFYAEGVQVGICELDGNCKEPVNLGTDGTVKMYADETKDYHIQILNLPEDYYFEHEEDSDYVSGMIASATDFNKTVYIFRKGETTTNTIKVTETLSQFADQEGKELAPVAMDGSATLVYNETDRFYHLGTADGPVVVVLLTKPNDTSRFAEEGALAYFELLNPRAASYVYDVTPEGAPENTKVMNDYRMFLRGFVDYEYIDGKFGPVPSIPENITTETYYTKYVNKDGVYPLTKELETFLKDFAKYNENFLYFNVPEDTEMGCEWLFSCYYYVTATPTDAIVGTYKLVSFTEEDVTYSVGDDYWGSPVTEDDKKLVISKQGFSVSEYNPRMGNTTIFTGNWSKDDSGVYSFTDCKNAFDEAVTAALTFNATTGEITVTFTDDFGAMTYVFKKA